LETSGFKTIRSKSICFIFFNAELAELKPDNTKLRTKQLKAQR
jgi:hypothetical protein